ncbi:MAG: hypothetical protein H0W83_10085, partial [Planctomycetes bacterium]|nr:hypothetical protein [Planctomycetota bacterium]
FSEVAAELRVPVGTAKTRVHRALIALRSRLRPLAGALSVAEIPQRLMDIPVGASAPLPTGFHALLDAPLRASVSGMPTVGAVSMTLKIALLCTATLTIGALPMLLSQEAPPSLIVVGSTQEPGVRTATVGLPAMPEMLKKGVSFDFQDQPLSEVAGFLTGISGVPIVLADGVPKDQPMTMAATDMSLAHVLSWMTRFSKTDWTLVDGTVLIAPRDRAPDAGHGFVGGIDDAAWTKSTQLQLDQQVTLDFQDTDLSDAISFVHKVTGVNMLIDPALIAASPPPVTMKVDHMALRFVLDFVARGAGVAYELRDQVVYWHVAAPRAEGGVVAAVPVAPDADMPWRKTMADRLQQPVSCEFKEQSVEDIVSFLRQVTGCNIIVTPEVLALKHPRTVTVTLKDETFEAALDTITALADLEYTIKNQAIVITLAKIAPARVVAAPAAPAVAAPEAAPAALASTALITHTYDLTGLPASTSADLVALTPQSWQRAGVGAIEANGAWTVTQTADVHQALRARLAAIHATRAAEEQAKRAAPAAAPLRDF